MGSVLLVLILWVIICVKFGFFEKILENFFSKFLIFFFCDVVKLFEIKIFFYVFLLFRDGIWFLWGNDIFGDFGNIKVVILFLFCYLFNKLIW